METDVLCIFSFILYLRQVSRLSKISRVRTNQATESIVPSSVLHLKTQCNALEKWLEQT